MAIAAEEVEYFRELLSDLPLFRERMPGIAISCDIQVTETAAGNDLYNGWKKIMRIHYAHISILLKRDMITVIGVRSQKNLTDPFTKGLARGFVEMTSKGIRLMSTL